MRYKIFLLSAPFIINNSIAEFYASGAINIYNDTFKSTFSINTEENTTARSLEKPVSIPGIGIEAGYLKKGSFAYGGNLKINLNPNTVKIGDDISYKSPINFNLNAIFGKHISREAVVYGTLGLGLTNIRYKNNLSLEDTTYSGYTKDMIIGIGLEYDMPHAPEWRVFFEYNVNIPLNKYKFKEEDIEYVVSNQYSTFKVGLRYYFL